MHGPTFMGNPLACAVALASIELLLASPWQARVRGIETQLRSELEPCRESAAALQTCACSARSAWSSLHGRSTWRASSPPSSSEGVWLRPFGKLVYTMPPYVIEPDELARVTRAMVSVLGRG